MSLCVCEREQEREREDSPSIDSFTQKPLYMDSEIKFFKIDNKKIVLPPNSCMLLFYPEYSLLLVIQELLQLEDPPLLLMRDEICPAPLGDGFLFCRLL